MSGPEWFRDAAFNFRSSRRRHLLRSERMDIRLVVGISLGGIPAVLVAALVVKSLPLTALRWGVVAVVIYAATI